MLPLSTYIKMKYDGTLPAIPGASPKMARKDTLAPTFGDSLIGEIEKKEEYPHGKCFGGLVAIAVVCATYGFIVVVL